MVIAGHGTERNENSRMAIERQVELIRAQDLYAEVHAVFLEEAPRIADCYKMAGTRNVVIVPFFISDGLHSREDIPVLLGEAKSIVQQRLQAAMRSGTGKSQNPGQPAWRNPTEKHGKLVWYSSSIGTEPHIADVILERVREAAQWVDDRASLC